MRPTTTGGIPISAFKVAITQRRALKRESANHAPKGIPTSEASTVAVRVTCNDRSVTSNNPIQRVSSLLIILPYHGLIHSISPDWTPPMSKPPHP